MKKMPMKFLSVLLAVLMVLPTVATAFPFLNSIVTVEAVTSIANKVSVSVPETIYLTPINGTMTDFQYSINNTMDSAGNIKLEAIANQNLMKVYFKCAGATLNSVTLSSGSASMETKTVSLSGSDGFYSNESINLTNDTSYALSSGLSANATGTIKWTFNYTVNGEKYTTYAFTTVYAPTRTLGASAVGKAAHKNYYNRTTSLITGAHSVTTTYSYIGKNTNDETDDYGYFTNDPMIDMNTVYHASSKTFDSRITDVSTSYSADLADVWASSYYSANENQDTWQRSKLGILTYDASRYSQLSTIPNVRVGVELNDGMNTRDYNCYIKGYYYFGTLQYGYAENIFDGYCDSFPNYDGWNWIVNAQDGSYSKADGVMYAGVTEQSSGFNFFKNCTADTQAARWYMVPSGNLPKTGKSYLIAVSNGQSQYQSNGSNYYSTTYTELELTAVDKTALRAAVKQAVTGGYQEEMYTADSWNNFIEAYKAAALKLGDPTATDVSADALTRAISGLTPKTASVNIKQVTESGIAKSSSSDTAAYGSNYSVTAGDINYYDFAKTEIYEYLVNDTEAHSGTYTENSSGYVNFLEYAVSAPFNAGDVYVLECDTIATGKVSNYFYGGNNYRQVATAVATANDKSVTYTGSDGDNTIPESEAYQHYKVVFTLSANGNGDVEKLLLFRLWPGASLSIRNIKLMKLTTVTSKETEYYIDEVRYDFVEIYSPKNYSISYDLAKGELSKENPTSYNIETDTFTLNKPTREGYTFAGWTGTGLDVAATDVSIKNGSTGDRTYVATWTARQDIKYVVNHYLMNVTGTAYELYASEPKQGATDASITLSSLQKSYDYFTYEGGKGATEASAEKPDTFDDTTTVLVGGTRVINLYYERNQYDITFKNHDGSVLKTEKFYYGATPSYSGTPEKDSTATYHYTFSGWSPTFATVTKDAEYTAKFTSASHSWGDAVETTPVSCIENGVNTYTCKVCGKTKTETIKATGHTPETIPAVAATCAATGLTEGKKCSVCGTVIEEQQTVAKKAHTYTTYVSNNDATCTTDGTKTAKCENYANCGSENTITDVGSKLGHDFKDYKSNNDATCTVDGTETAKCSRCTVTDTRTAVGSKLGHDFKNYKSNNDATCVADGTKTAKCERCDEIDTVTDEGSKLDHTEVEDVAVAATCTTPGKTAGSHCSVCMTVIKAQEEIPAKGHTFTTYNYNNDATCTADGTETAKCDDCDVTDTRPAEEHKKGHSFTSYISNNDATCIADGTKTAKCDRCDATDTIADEGSVKGHSFTNYVSNDDATCIADGTKTAKCDRCDATDTIADEGSVKGHSFTSYVSNNDATCTADGTETAKCDRCDETDTRVAEGSAKGHTPRAAVKDNVVNASCLTDGSYEEVVYCSECKAELSRTQKTITAPGHTVVVDEAKAATCLFDGLTEGSHCLVCKEILVAQETVPALDHDFGEWTVQKAAKCKTSGKEVRSCSRCKVTETRTIPATGHEIVIDEAIPATCITEGKTEGSHCSKCNLVVKPQATVPARGHDYVKTVISLPTCADEGLAEYKCSRCTDSYTAVLEKLDHTPGKAVVENKVAATETEEGHYDSVVYCTECGEEISRKTVITHGSHSGYDTTDECPACPLLDVADEMGSDTAMGKLVLFIHTVLHTIFKMFDFVIDG